MNLKLFPSDNFTICTEDSISVVRQKLMEHVENPQMIRSLNNCNFKGVVSDYKFEIRPIYKYNFHAPIVIGKFESFPNETLINLRITLRFHQYFFIVILFYQLIFIFKILIESYLPCHTTGALWQALYWTNIILCSSIIGLNLRFYLIEYKFAKAKLTQIFLS